MTEEPSPIPSSGGEGVGNGEDNPMADPAEETDEEVPDDEDAKGLRARLKEQSAARREAEAKAAEADSLRQELALHRAGLGNLSERQQKALFATHEGEISAETLQATAKDLFGAVPAAGAPSAPAQTPETNEALGQMEQFAAGGTNVEPPPPAKEAFMKAVTEWTGTGDELDEFIFVQNKHLLDSQ